MELLNWSPGSGVPVLARLTPRAPPSDGEVVAGAQESEGSQIIHIWGTEHGDPKQVPGRHVHAYSAHRRSHVARCTRPAAALPRCCAAPSPPPAPTPRATPALQTLEGATEGVRTMLWHPCPLTMQLLTLGARTGRVYIWAKVCS